MHDIEEALNIAHRIVVLSGRPATVIEEYVIYGRGSARQGPAGDQIHASNGGKRMKYLKNVPNTEVAALEGLISIREGQIVSMAMSRSDQTQIVLFAIAAGELISEEIYPGDTLYYVLSGGIQIRQDQEVLLVRAGEVLAVCADILHSLQALQDTKLLQITVNE